MYTHFSRNFTTLLEDADDEIFEHQFWKDLSPKIDEKKILNDYDNLLQRGPFAQFRQISNVQRNTKLLVNYLTSKRPDILIST